MKPKLSSRRKAGTFFLSVDKATGYAVRFALGTGGIWWAGAVAFPALSNGKTLAMTRRHIAEAIQITLEEVKTHGHPLPPPEYTPNA